MARGFSIRNMFLYSFLLFFYLIFSSEAIPRVKLRKDEGNRTTKAEISNSTYGLKGERLYLGETSPIGEFHDRTIQIESLTSGLTNMITCVTNSLSAIIGNITGNASGGLGNLTSLFMKPSGGTGKPTNLLQKPSGGIGGSFNLNKNISTGIGGGIGGGGCDLFDPLLLANIPGIFFWTPIVILAVSILVGVVAAIIIAIGGLGSNITDSIYDMIKDKMNQGGYADSVSSSSYGPPSSSYGSPSSYSRLTESFDQLTDNFNNAYDKYSALQTQSQSQSQQPVYQNDQQNQNIFKDYYENQSQYDRWNQIAKARRG